MQQYQTRIKNYIRALFSDLAVIINRRFGTSVTPAGITWTGFIAHIPIAYLISQDLLITAGLLLIIFGLFDTLDGALARAQKTASPRGMFLDASTDRLKEVILYTGFVVLFLDREIDWAVAITVLACGLSLAVSYVKAKGEAAIASLDKRIDHHELNQIFSDGLGSFEVRILILVIGCLSGFPQYAVAVVAAIAAFTVYTRFIKIMKALS